MDKKCLCIIQLSRTGDILQTIKAAKYQFIDQQFTKIFIGRKRYAEGLRFELEQIFDKIYLVDLPELFKEEDFTLNAIKFNFLKFFNKINENNITVSINLTFSKMSEYFHSLVQSEFKLGSYRNYQGNIVIPDKWSQFIYAITMKGPYSPFHLTDIYRKIIGGPFQNPQTSSQGNINTDSYIIIHPFSSSQKKSWNFEKWTRFMKILIDAGHTLYLVGDKNDYDHHQEKIEHFQKTHTDKVRSFIGKISLSELKEIINNAGLVIGHDSMVINLASLYNKRSIVLSLGTVRPHETTSHTDDALTITPTISCFPCFPDTPCSHYNCHNDLDLNEVAHVVKLFITQDDMDKKFLDPLKNVKIYKNILNEEVGLYLEEIKNDIPTIDDLFRSYYFILWSCLLSGHDLEINPPVLSTKFKNDLLELRSVNERLYELYEFGKKYSLFLKAAGEEETTTKNQFSDIMNKFTEIMTLSLEIGEKFPALSPLSQYYYVVFSNVEASNINQLAMCYFDIFEESSLSTTILNDLMTQTIKSYGWPDEGVSIAKQN